MVFQVIDQCSKEFILSAFKTEKFKTDSIVFRLHYKLSTWLVILYSVCYMYVQIDSPISCIASGGRGNKKSMSSIANARKVISDFCWVHGTYSVTLSNSGGGEMYPGIRGVTSTNDEVFYHQYYKWMLFYIVSMLILLHIPRQAWRFIEGGRMGRIASKLNWTILIRDEEIVKEEVKLADYLFSHLGYHQRYALGFLLCELLNVGVTGSLLYMWDLISGHQLSVYGWGSVGLLQVPPIYRNDTLAKVFPLLSKCTFNVYGAGGNVVPHDVLCVLPLNVINERAAVFFWCYFMILVAVGIVELVYRMMLLLSRRLRSAVMSGASPLTPMEDINLIVANCTYSDWFVISQLSSCLEAVVYRQVLQKYVEKLRLKGDLKETP